MESGTENPTGAGASGLVCPPPHPFFPVDQNFEKTQRRPHHGGHNLRLITKKSTGKLPSLARSRLYHSLSALDRSGKLWSKFYSGEEENIKKVLEAVAGDHLIITDPEDNKNRRTLIIQRMQGQKFGFTVQSYTFKNSVVQSLEKLSYVDNIELNSPAYFAGMRRGDVILSINGQTLRDKRHEEVIEFINHCLTMRVVVLFEDCARKVELFSRSIKLKKLLCDKEFELRILDLQERRLIQGLPLLSSDETLYYLRSSSNSSPALSVDSRSFSIPPDWCIEGNEDEEEKDIGTNTTPGDCHYGKEAGDMVLNTDIQTLSKEKISSGSDGKFPIPSCLSLVEKSKCCGEEEEFSFLPVDGAVSDNLSSVTAFVDNQSPVHSVEVTRYRLPPVVQSYVIIHRGFASYPGGLWDRYKQRLIKLNRRIVGGYKASLADLKCFCEVVRDMYKGKDLAEFSVRQLEVYVQTPSDLVKIPIIIALVVMPMTIVLLAFAFLFFPRFLLTRHFWSAKQTVKFRQAILNHRKQFHHSQLISALTLKFERLNVSVCLSRGMDLAEMLRLNDVFRNHFDLHSLQWLHKYHLCRSHGIFPFFGANARLEKRAKVLRVMDRKLKEVSELPPTTVSELCSENSLENDSSLLKRWITFTSDPPISETLIMHAPVLLQQKRLEKQKD